VKNLLYKEFRLSIHPLFYLTLLFGALLLIPQWPFLIALMYFFFIVVPNIFSNGKAQNDVMFSVMLPVRKRDVVKARILSIVILELLQILAAAAFAALKMLFLTTSNFLMDPNIAFFGFAFMMYAVFNAFFFPIFYKTAYRIGIPVIAGSAAAVFFAAAAELAVQAIPALRVLDGTGHTGAQASVLAAGIVIFALVNFAAYRISVRRFERVDL